jgi:hypothetical protein
MIDNNIVKVLMSAHQARSFEQTQFCAVGACG